MLSVTNKHIMLNVAMLSVVMLNAVAEYVNGAKKLARYLALGSKDLHRQTL